MHRGERERRSDRRIGLSLMSLLILVVSLVTVTCEGTPDKDMEQPYRTMHHDIRITLYPSEQRFTAEDTITVPETTDHDLRFMLHRGLDPKSLTSGVLLQKSEDEGEHVSVRANLPRGLRTLTIQYGGVIHHPLEPYGKEAARGFSQTPGIISNEGVYLGGSSYWYPAFENALVTFNLTVELPRGWDAVSQGERKDHLKDDKKTHVTWVSPEPQDEIFLIAGRFTEYARPGRVSAMVFLRSADAELAAKYLEATRRYIAMYEELIGPYPYKKFALVENFWETGYGMPSFTLLGPKIIRLPFIIDSSYPHEILHTWWGNSVFPDYGKGNWSEGLTAYLSDHLIKEQQGEGSEYRETTLQKYADYVIRERDFPLREFRSRHSSSSEAIGYGKSLMFFHMLRLALGDKTFRAGLQEFYRDNTFRLTTFDDLRKSFEKASGRDLGAQFRQWVERAGAPQLKIGKTMVAKEDDTFIVRMTIEQVQPGSSYALHVPLAVTMERREKAYQAVVTVEGARDEISLRLPARPLRIDVDPEFDLFRMLDRREIPPAISQALGSERMLIILPSSAGNRSLQVYEELARVISKAGPENVEVRLDTDVNRPPADRAVTVLGWENRYSPWVLSTFPKDHAALQDGDISVARTLFSRRDHAVVLTGRHPGNPDLPVMLVAADNSRALPGLGRKLPHYHKYSYLVFEGDEPTNVAKGRWRISDSPMTVFFADGSGRAPRVDRGTLIGREPLMKAQRGPSADRMIEMVRFLASDELRGRGFGSPGLERAGQYIAEKFREVGLKPAGDSEGSFFQAWKESGVGQGNDVLLRNVVGVIPGRNEGRGQENVVVGAHYDHLGTAGPDVRADNKGKIHPGADDNASGVAVLLELARLLGQGPRPDRTVVFVAFTGEEAGKKGSRHYITAEGGQSAKRSIGMINLDTVGRLGHRKLLILGTGSAKEWVEIFRGASLVTGVDVETANEELDSSDQISFHEAGVPAVQFFTGPHPDYHRPADTAERVDSAGLVKVASVAREAIEYLASGQAFVTPTLSAGKVQEPSPKKERRVSLGTIPDFAYTGNGCRLSGVVPGSPAEASGLREGDIIVKVNSSLVGGLKDLSEILKSLSPGAMVTITFLRGEKEMIVEAEVKPK